MNPLSALQNYFRSSKAELEKVSWPSRQDTIRYSALVIAASLAAAVFFGTLDFGLGKAVEGLLARRLPSASAPVEPASPTNEPSALPPINLEAPQVEAVTNNGLPADIKVTPVPLDGATKK